MGSVEKIQSLVTSDSITIYWEKRRGGKEEYRISVNGEHRGSTDKTHYKLEGLEPETEYRISVQTEERDTDEGIGAKRGAWIDMDTDIDTDKCSTGICAEPNQAIAGSELCFRTGKVKRRLDITKPPYCAVGDGKTMNTKVIQQAIDDCGEMEAVYIPAGVFMTGALRLHSDMELYVERDGVLQGTDVVEDYLPRIKSRFEGTEMECYSSLLNLGKLDREAGYNCRNVVIRGEGTIASGGRSLAEKVISSEREYLKEYLASLGDRIDECEKPETIPGRVRPRLINMSNCQNVVLSGLTLKNGASWNVHMIYSDSIVTNDCTFYSEQVWNGDGWDPDSSTNCTIFHCIFHTGDDSIAIKSGKNPEGTVIAKPSRHIRIFDCRSEFGHGIIIGSEMSGGVEDVAIWDCDMSRSQFGIEIKGTKKRGGYVRNVTVKDCLVSRILFHSVGYNDDGIAAPLPPVFENCSFDHVDVLGEYLDDNHQWVPCEAIELCGFDEPGHELKQIICSNLRLGRPGERRKQTISLELCENITFSHVGTAKIDQNR